MENALKLWQEAEMPKLNLRTPWYGYPLGLWDEEDDRLAEKVAHEGSLSVVNRSIS